MSTTFDWGLLVLIVEWLAQINVDEMHITDLHMVKIGQFFLSQCWHSNRRIVPHADNLENWNLIVEAAENYGLGIRNDLNYVFMVNVLFNDRREHVSLRIFIKLDIWLQEKDNCAIGTSCSDVNLTLIQKMKTINLKAGAGIGLWHQDASRIEIIDLHDTRLVTNGDHFLLAAFSDGGFGFHNRDCLNCSLDCSLGLTTQRHFVFENICFT